MTTHMLTEARSAPAKIASQLAANKPIVADFANQLKRQSRPHIVTIARGSSDHAASYFSYLVMARVGRWVTSLPMSLVTMENAPLTGAGVASFAFSQSGRSPDLIAPTEHLRRTGALTAAFVNVEQSPLASAAEICIPLHAGAEQSVAATKSFIAQLVAGAHLVAEWTEDASLMNAICELPAALAQAVNQDWTAAIAPLTNVERLFVIGRGTGLAIAQEAALKFKETCGIQAEAFSGAEVKHGPMALIKGGYPLIVFAPRGATQAGLVSLAQEMRLRGANVWLVAPTDGSLPGVKVDLPLATTGAPALDAISCVQSFYPLVEALARARGYDPDTPSFLSKVTLTQ